MRTRIWSGGSFAIAIVATAVVLGAPSPDQWVQLWQDARRAFSRPMSITWPLLPPPLHHGKAYLCANKPLGWLRPCIGGGLEVMGLAGGIGLGSTFAMWASAGPCPALRCGANSCTPANDVHGFNDLLDQTPAISQNGRYG